MALSDTRDYVLAVENNKQEAFRIATSTARKLESREITLIDVVQSLGEYINDEDEKIRARAVSYLTAVISSLQHTYLSRQQIQVLCDFLCARIEDGGAIDGLSKLQGLDRFTKDMAQTVVKALFEHFPDLQNKNQAARHKVYQLLNEIMQNYRKAVRELGDESLVGTIELVAGEKDPRNLMLIFSILRVVMVEWDISRHTDIVFDSVYAYFPITFRPPPNDPYGITAQDLKNRLRDCLASTGVLAPSVIPNLLDRLDSTSPTVKRDVLQAFKACTETYDASTMGQYAITLWDAVKFEVSQAQEPELADEALLVITGIAACLSKTRNTSPTASPLIQYLKPVNKECLEYLQEPAGRQAKAAGDILKAAASASIQSFEIVIKAIGPALLTIYQSSEGILQQRAVLEVTNQLFEAALVVYGSWMSPTNKNPDGRENLLSEFKDKFIAIYSQALMGTIKEEVSFRLTAATGLLLVSKMNSLLEDTEIGLIVQYYNEIVLKEESYGRDELKRKAMTALADISKFKPRLISDITFPAFMARLPDTEEEAKGSDYQSVLEGLAEISVEKELLETLMRRLLNKLDLLFRSDSSGPFRYACTILGTIYYALDHTVVAQNVTLDAYYDRVVVGLSKSASVSRAGPLSDDAVLDLLGRIMNLICRKSSLEHVQQVADNVYTLFRGTGDDNDSKHLVVSIENPTTILLSTWLLASLPRTLQATVLRKNCVIQNIEDLAISALKTKHQAIELSCLRQIALYINKHLSNADLDFVDRFLAARHVELTDSSSNDHLITEDRRLEEFNVRLCFFVTKALTLRLAPKTNEYLQSLVELLRPLQNRPGVSKSAAMGFGALLSPDDLLSKTNAAQIRLLAPQRVFQVLTPLISNRFKDSASAVEKENCLVALSGVLATVPSEIVMPELPTLLPLLLQSLDISDQTVKTATLETLAVVISSNPTALEESGHIPALAKRLLATATLGKKLPSKQESVLGSPRTRRLATRCLTLMPKYISGSGSRANPLLSLKPDVLRELTVVLDDPKRDVRKEAVDARAAWIRGVDDPEDDDDDDD